MGLKYIIIEEHKEPLRELKSDQNGIEIEKAPESFEDYPELKSDQNGIEINLKYDKRKDELC